MNDNSIEYAKMIEIPINSCEYHTNKKPRFFSKKNFIKRVNENILSDQQTDLAQQSSFEEGDALPTANNIVLKKIESEDSTKTSRKEAIKSKIITAQIITVFTLAVAIVLTNIFWENSGMNTLFKSVFAGNEQNVDDRSAEDFSLILPIKSEGVTLENGVVTVSGEYSLYPVCEGKISKIERASDGTFTLTIEHSDNFSSIIEGADFVYFSEGEEVNKSVPVCHTATLAKVYLYENGSLLTDLVAIENSLVFNR